MKRTMMIIIVMAALAAMAQEERRVFPLELSPFGAAFSSTPDETTRRFE